MIIRGDTMKGRGADVLLKSGGQRAGAHRVKKVKAWPLDFCTVVSTKQPMFNDLSALLQEMDKETLNWGQSENIEKLRVRHTGELLLVQIVQKQMKA